MECERTYLFRKVIITCIVSNYCANQNENTSICYDSDLYTKDEICVAL